MPKPNSATARVHVSKGGHAFSYADFLRWLGQRQHARKLKRTCTPEVNDSGEPLVRLVNEMFPWSTGQYPGRIALAAHILGIKPVTAKRYMAGGSIHLPRKHHARIIAYLHSRVASINALILALEKE